VITLNLLEPMSEVINMIGSPMRGAGWYGHTTGLHTVAIRVLNFQGRVSVQATVATEPTDTDWYSVLPNGVPYIQYPQLSYVLQMPSNGETSIFGFNFSTNAVWVRAVVTRDYLIPPVFMPVQIMPFGVVDYVKLSYS
jgi:hypothetical protein